jgi:hypothetical protein
MTGAPVGVPSDGFPFLEGSGGGEEYEVKLGLDVDVGGRNVFATSFPAGAAMAVPGARAGVFFWCGKEKHE